MHFKLVAAGMFDDDGWFDGTESDLTLRPVALSEDGWADAVESRPAARRTDNREASMYPGDLVLYRCEGNLVPAALIEPAADGRWLARDSRHGRSLFHLAPESIATRLLRRDSHEAL